MLKEKSQIEKDGQSLMLSAWGCDNGVLKITSCITQTDKDFQDVNYYPFFGPLFVFS